MNFAKHSQLLKDYIISARRFIHSHAELSLSEHNTTDFIVSELKKDGIPVITFKDYMGCIAVIKGGKNGKTVLLRGDIDALPIKEETNLPFASLTDGVMHACGHDFHSSMLLCAAKMLWKNKEQLCGTVKLLFQSGEEVFIGSHYYWDKGFLSDVAAAFAMHVWPTLKSGKIAVVDGELMSACDNFNLKVTPNPVSSIPNAKRNTVLAASAITVALQSIVSRFNNPLHPLVVTVGKISGNGDSSVEAEGTVRSFSPESRALVEPALREICVKTASLYGCNAEIKYDYLQSAIINKDLHLNQIARQAALKLFGNDILSPTPPTMASEDFSYIMDRIPSSVFAFLGTYDEQKGYIYPTHYGKFAADEAILPIGAALYAQFALDYLDDTKNFDKEDNSNE